LTGSSRPLFSGHLHPCICLPVALLPGSRVMFFPPAESRDRYGLQNGSFASLSLTFISHFSAQTTLSGALVHSNLSPSFLVDFHGVPCIVTHILPWIREKAPHHPGIPGTGQLANKYTFDIVRSKLTNLPVKASLNISQL